MNNFWNEQFLKNLEISTIKTIFEVGSRYGDETLAKNNIHFNSFALGINNEELPFYSYVIDNNDDASSLLKRIDYEYTQTQTGIITVKKMSDFVFENNIKQVDLLCMDVQGF